MNNKDFEITKLEKNKPIPLYYQIELFLRDQISSGKLKPGDQILTEENLCEKFGVSRATVRRGISKLVYEGLLKRNYSKGTIVSQPKITQTQNLFEATSFTSAILKANKDIRTKILEFKRIKSNKFISNILDTDKGEYMHFIKRARYVENVPVCVEELYLPVKLFPDLSIGLFEESGINQSTYHVLEEHFNINVKHIKDTMSAVSVDRKDAILLDIKSKSPALLRQRVSFDENKQPLTFSSGRYIIDIEISF